MGPRQSIHVVHDTPTKLTLYNPERWDTVYEGAPEAGIKVNSAIQEQQLIILFQVRQRKQLRLERDLPRDIIAFTKWLSKHSPAIAAPLIGGTLYDDKW